MTRAIMTAGFEPAACSVSTKWNGAIGGLPRTAGDGYRHTYIERDTKNARPGEIISHRSRGVVLGSGTSTEELEVVIEEGKRADRARPARKKTDRTRRREEARSYLHRGIAARQFQRHLSCWRKESRCVGRKHEGTVS